MQAPAYGFYKLYGAVIQPWLSAPRAQQVRAAALFTSDRLFVLQHVARLLFYQGWLACRISRNQSWIGRNGNELRSEQKGDGCDDTSLDGL